MLDKGAPTSQRALAELANAATRKNLLRYAIWRTGDEDDAKDLLAEAVHWVLDPERKPWVKETITFRRHMRSVMNDLAIESGRTAQARHEINESKLVAQTGDDEAFPDPGDGRPGPDEALDEGRASEIMRRIWKRIEPHFREHDPICVRVYEASCKNCETPAEQAELLKVPVEEVYEALRRMRYRAEIAMAEWRREEARVMFDARQQARREGTAT